MVLKKAFFSYLLLTLIVVVFENCNINKDNLQLSKYKIPERADVDTIELYNRNLALLGVITNHPFGKFEYDYVVIKGWPKNKVGYKIENDKLSVRTSKDLIALVNSTGQVNWGWFYMTNKKPGAALPMARNVMDSLMKIYTSDSFFIRETNGYFSVYSNGKVVKRLNYGNLVLGSDRLDFDSLSYGLYHLETKVLKKISDKPDDLFIQNEGVFFVPPPGYGIVIKVQKQNALNIVDSATKSFYPKKIIVNSFF